MRAYGVGGNIRRGWKERSTSAGERGVCGDETKEKWRGDRGSMDATPRGTIPGPTTQQREFHQQQASPANCVVL